MLAAILNVPVPLSPGMAAVGVEVPDTVNEVPVAVFVRTIVKFAVPFAGKSSPGVVGAEFVTEMVYVTESPGLAEEGVALTPVTLSWGTACAVAPATRTPNVARRIRIQGFITTPREK